jgi:Ca-activated chloride channel family protein
MKFKKIISLFILIFLISGFVKSQVPKTRILFLLDGSGSMWGYWEKEQKIVVAKRLLSHLVDSLGDVPNVELALRAYGHRSPKAKQDCKDTKLEVPFGPRNQVQIKEKLKNIFPKGTTPISYSLSMAANDFPKDGGGFRNIIILITDGIEECSGDPCAVSLELQRRGIILKPFVIGLGITDDLFPELECMGNFFNATDEESFARILRVVITNALNNTTCQVNLLDSYGDPSETNVNMTFYDNKNGIIKYNFYHTLNSKGLPDTLYIDPTSRYNLVVHTIPPVAKDNVALTSGRHNTIAVDAPQGYLEVKITGITSYKNLAAIVRDNETGKIYHVQYFNSLQKYLTGKYAVEILTLPRISLKDVEIKQSHTTTINVPQPGTLTIYSSIFMIGSIYEWIDNKLVWITDIDPTKKSQDLVMQPGTYRISYRGKDISKTSYTNDKTFKITSGGATRIMLK